MNYLNGGYAMIKHNASQKDLENAYKTNRPVLVYDENQRAHWAVIEEKATESVDEETQEPITIYEYSYRLIDEVSGGATLDNIVDSAGNKRFIEGDGTPITMEGVTIPYCKWSLSGTHLMFVIVGTYESGVVFNGGEALATFELPSYIKDKILPTFTDNLSNEIVELKIVSIYDNIGNSKSFGIKEVKISTGIKLISNAYVNSDKQRTFRVQFDLLIDADYSE